MKKIFTSLTAELTAGRGAVLCSIISSSGSAPRGAGAKMLVTENGVTTGTIGGGAVEYRVTQLAQTLCAEKRSIFSDYRLTPEENDSIGMICGGSVRVYLQYFNPEDPDVLPVLEDISGLLSGARAAWLVTVIEEDGGWQMGTYDHKNGLRFLSGVTEKDLDPLPDSKGVFHEGRPALYIEPLRQAGTAYIFGGGHIGRELAYILARTDFRVTIWDERPDAATREFFPDAAGIYCGSYNGAFAKLPSVTTDDYIIIMTPGHQADYTVLAQALRTPARYIGCIGSRKKVAATRERLLSDGFTSKDADRVHAPIGLRIGGETPAEIAVSIAAEMIACRWGRLDGSEENGHAAN